jgi:hypothetical protein
MKSCQTRIPSSSHRSWNAADSYAAVPGIRTMFIPAARSDSSSTRSVAADGAGPVASSGVQTAPRTNTGTPFTASCRPSASSRSAPAS